MGTSEGARKGWTPESRAKRAEAMRRKWRDPEYRAKRAAKEQDPQTKANRSASAVRANSDPGRRHQQSERMKQKFAEPDFRERHAAGMRQAYADNPEINERRAASMRRAWAEAPERFEGSLEAVRTDAASEEGKRRRSETLRQQWAHDERLPQNLHDIRAQRLPTGLELAVAEALNERDISYMLRYHVKRWELDVFIPSLMLDVEADGAYWHDDDIWPGRADFDARRDAALTELGYTVLRLTEDEITAQDWGRLDAEIARLS